MKNANPIHDRFMRLAMYVHKRRNGATVYVRRKVQVQADPKTGQTVWTIQTWKIRHVVPLPVKIQRDAKMNAGAMTANRAIIQGGGYDTGARRFLFDCREVPADLVLAKDDWIVFNDRHYDIEVIQEYEFYTAWEVMGRELRGRREVIDEIHNPIKFAMDASDQLVLGSHAANQITHP